MQQIKNRSCVDGKLWDTNELFPSCRAITGRRMTNLFDCSVDCRFDCSVDCRVDCVLDCSLVGVASFLTVSLTESQRRKGRPR